MTSPPVVMMLASTDGTNSTLIGCSGEPTAGSGGSVGAAVGASVGASVDTGDASVGAGGAGAQAETASTTIVITARSRCRFFFIFFSSERFGLGKIPIEP